MAGFEVSIYGRFWVLTEDFGRADDAKVRERLGQLARGIMRRVAPEDLVQDKPDWKLIEAWPYGDLYVLTQLWNKIGLPELLPELTRDDSRRTLPVERACFAMVANRCCAPASKLYLFEQWLREDVRIEGLRRPRAAPPLPQHGLLRAPQRGLREEPLLPRRRPLLCRCRSRLL